MAGEFTQETILDFLKERGGKVKNTELIEHFQLALIREPLRNAAARRTFKSYVDNVAFVKTERGVKHVCLRRMFSGTVKPESPAESVSEPAFGRQVSGDDVDDAAAIAEERPLPGAARAQVQQQQQRTAPGSGCGSEKGAVPRFLRAESGALLDEREETRARLGFVCVAEEADDGSGEMGNRASFKREKEGPCRKLDIPEVTVIEASPLPVEGAVFILPGPVEAGSLDLGLGPRGRHAETGMRSPEALKGAEHVWILSKHQESDDRDGDSCLDVLGLSASEESGTPKGSRKHFLEAMISSSPQVRRSVAFHNSPDSVSLSSAEDERTPVTLDPVEHEWMMCASDAEWGSLSRLLTAEPGLVLRKDFVTGFTCLHWAAKHGKPELMALIVDFAKKHGLPLSVDVRSNVGYTPLHVAAMHNHVEVVKLLVGAYDADVDIRDYSGRKAYQYLKDGASVDIRDIVGACGHSEAENDHDGRGRGHWRFSKVLRSSLKHLSSDRDSPDGEGRPREPPVRRRSSLSGMKPKLQKLRLRTSQIVHSTSFRSKEDLESPKRGSFRSRPKTHFFS